MTAPPRSPATGRSVVGELVAHDAAQPREAVVGAGLGGEVVARPPVADEAEGHIGARHRGFGEAFGRRLRLGAGRCAGISAAPGWRRTGRGLLPASRRRGRRGGALPRRLPRPRATTRRRRRGRGSRSAAGRRRPMDGSASPRKPRVETAERSSQSSFEVTWRSNREREFVAAHAAAVVAHRHRALAAARQRRLDAARAGVEGRSRRAP